MHALLNRQSPKSEIQSSALYSARTANYRHVSGCPNLQTPRVRYAYRTPCSNAISAISGAMRYTFRQSLPLTLEEW
jgi:hypothetical protein